MRRITKISALFLLFFICAPLPYLSAEDKIIAVVNNEVITQKELDDFANFMRIQLSSEYKGKELEEKINSMMPGLLSRLIEDRLILQEAKKSQIIISPDRIKARIEEIRRKYRSDAEFNRALQMQGLVRSDLEEQIKEQLLMYSVVDLKVKSRVRVSPCEVTDFYEQHQDEFQLPEARVVESVATENKEIADSIFKRLQSREDFKDIAMRFSLSLEELTVYKSGQLKKEAEDAIFAINNIGEFTRPTEVENKYYIFKLNKIIPPRQQSLVEVQDEISFMLTNTKLQEALDKWINEIKRNSYIKILSG